jgi:hypothetical protein
MILYNKLFIGKDINQIVLKEIGHAPGIKKKSDIHQGIEKKRRRLAKDQNLQERNQKKENHQQSSIYNLI